jgi:uncharacterized membrane protein
MQMMVQSGPLPPPETLEKYKAVDPSLPERIMAMAERQSSHRQAMEKKLVEGQVRSQTLGQVFGLTMGVGVLGLAAWFAHLHMPELATVIAGLDLASLVGVFVYGKRKNE